MPSSTDKQPEIESSPEPSLETGRGPMARRGVRPTLWTALHSTRAARYARLGTFLAVLLGLSSWFAFERTHAQIGDDLLGAGAALMEFADAEHTDGPRALSLNGEMIHLVSGSTPESLDSVLTSFEEVCLQRDAEFRQQITDFYAEHPDAERREIMERFRPVIRRASSDGERGTVGCLDLGTERRTASQLLEAYAEYRSTGDLSRLGNIRYLFAQLADGDRTQYVSLWTEGEFHVDNILTGNGDAPGADLAGIPRPPNARRSLSAFELGRDDRFVIYQGSSMTEWELEHFYRTELESAGWTLGEAERENPDNQLVVALRDGRQVYVSLDTDRYGRGSAVVALTE